MSTRFIAASLRPALPAPLRSGAWTVSLTACLLLTPPTAALATRVQPIEPPAAFDVDSDPDAPANRLRSLLNEYDAWWRYEFPDAARAMFAETRADAITEFGIPIETRRNGIREVFLEELTSILSIARPDELRNAASDQADLLRWELTREIARHASGRSLLLVTEGRGPHWSLDGIVDQLAALPTVQSSSELAPDGERDPVSAASSWQAELETRLGRIEWIGHQCHATVEALRVAYERGHTPSRMEIDRLREDVRRALARGERRFAEALAAAERSMTPEAFASLTSRLQTRTLPALRDGMNALESFFASDAIAFARAEPGLAATPSGRERFAALFAEATTTAEGASPTIDDIAADAAEVLASAHAKLVAALSATAWAREAGWSAGDRRSVGEADLRAYRQALATRLGLAGDATANGARIDRLRSMASALHAALPALVRRMPQTPLTLRTTTDAPRGLPAAPSAADYLPGSIALGKPAIIEIDGDAIDSLLPHALLGAILGRHLEMALAAETAHARGGVHRSLASTMFSEGWRAYAATLLPSLLTALAPTATDAMAAIGGDDARALALLAQIEQAALAEAELAMHAFEAPAGTDRPSAAARLAEVTGWSQREVERALRRIALAPGEASAGYFGMRTILAARAAREADGRPLEAAHLAAFHTDALACGRGTLERLLTRMRLTSQPAVP